MFDKKDELEIVKRLTGIQDESRIEINEIGGGNHFKND